MRGLFHTWIGHHREALLRKLSSPGFLLLCIRSLWWALDTETEAPLHWWFDLKQCCCPVSAHKTLRNKAEINTTVNYQYSKYTFTKIFLTISTFHLHWMKHRWETCTSFKGWHCQQLLVVVIIESAAFLEGDFSLKLLGNNIVNLRIDIK